MGAADPSYVRVKESYFDWRECKQMKETNDDSDISNFYDVESNRMKFFDPGTANAEIEMTGTWVPKFPMIPTKVALKVAKSPTTPWELQQHPCNYKEDRDPEDQTMLKKAKM